MKKLISLLICFTMVFGGLTLVSSAEQTLKYEKDFACNKVFEVFRFSEDNYCKRLSSPTDIISFDENGGMNYEIDSLTDTYTMYFEVTKEQSDLIKDIYGISEVGFDFEGNECTEAMTLYLHTIFEYDGNIVDTGAKFFLNLIYEDGTESDASISELYQPPYYADNNSRTDEGQKVELFENFLSVDAKKTIKYICIQIYNSEDRDISGAKGSVSKIVCSYAIADHNTILVGAKKPTCTEPGAKGAMYCTVCGEYLTSGALTAPKGHTEVIDKAVAATCTADGKTEGKHCSACNKVIIKQETVKAAGHKNEWVETAATYFNEGKKELKCAVCGEVSKTETIAKLRLKTPDFKLIKAKGKFKVKVNNAACFQVRYKIKGKWKTKTFNSKKNTAKVIKNLKKGSYKVQIRSFVKSDKQKAYSRWSKIRKIKVK